MHFSNLKTSHGAPWGRIIVVIEKTILLAVLGLFLYWGYGKLTADEGDAYSRGRIDEAATRTCVNREITDLQARRGMVTDVEIEGIYYACRR